MPTDIFATPPWDNDDTCLIVGSGPELKPLLDDRLINVHCWDIVISLNKVINGLGLTDYWLCSAPGLLDEEWFTTYMRSYLNEDDDKREFKYPQPIFMLGPLTAAYPEVPYSFVGSGDLVKEPSCEPGILKCSGSVAGRALQLAYLKGIRDIVLAGVDMRGIYYFDGTFNATKKSMNPSGVWTAAPVVNGLIQWLKAHGCRVRSLTHTALDVEVI